MRFFILETFIVIVLLVRDVISVTPCNGNADIGETNPKEKTNDASDLDTDVAIIMYQGEFQFSCCGFLDEWRFYADPAYTGGPFDLQVWRENPGMNFDLIGSNTVTTATTGANEVANIAVGQRIRVANGDFIGIHATGSFPLRLGFVPSSNRQGCLKLTGITTAMTTPYNWSPAVNSQDIDYAVGAKVTKGSTPSFVGLADFVKYNDEVAVGQVVASIFGTDGDPEDAGSLTMTMQSASNSGTNYFDFTVGSGNITVIAVPPVGDYDITMKVEDPCTLSSNGNVKVTILNRPPVIHNMPASVSIEEDTAAALIFTINATDTITYPLLCFLGGGDSTKFEVKLIAPSISTYGVYSKSTAYYNYDVQTSHTATVTCDDGDDTVSADLTVNLIRNEPPTINSLPANTSFSEDLSTRTLLHTIGVTDAEGDAITCSISPASALFDVAPIPSTTSYGIYLTGGTTLDYDTKSTYVLPVECADQRRSKSEDYTVNLIRNMPPTIQTLPASIEIFEDTSTETYLYTVSVTDPTNDAVTCLITTTTSIFFMQTGSDQYNYDVYVRSNINFDYDVQKTYKLDISCSDKRRTVSSFLYIYLIRNMPPKFTNLQGKTILNSFTSGAGVPVLTITADDPENDILQFTMSSSGNHPFTINQNTGEVALTRSIRTETVTGYDVSVFVNDGRSTTGPGILTVIITGINRPPVLTNLPQTIWILEGVTVGSAVFQVLVKDYDIGNTHKFSVIYTPPEGAVYFNLNKTDGRLIPVTDIDYENIPYKEFNFDVTVTDSYMEDQGTLTVKILNVNESPNFIKSNYSLSASEAVAGTVLPDPHYQYVDEDGDTVKFNFDCQEKSGRFDMNSVTGLFSYAIEYDLDVAGTSSLVQCKVYISDNEYSDSANVNITVLDVNDNTPRFQHSSYTFFVPLNSVAGTYVGQVFATDEDIGNYGKLIYYVEQGTIESGVFEVLLNGTIRTKGLLADYTEGSILNFKVYAADSGDLESFTDVTIVIPEMSTDAKVITNDTIVFYTFFTYAPNMAWFVPAVCLAIIAGGALIYLLRTLKHDCTCLKGSKGPRKHRNRRVRDQSTYF